MALIAKGCLFGRVTNGMFTDGELTIPVSCKNNFNEVDYIFSGELHFDKMSRPMFQANHIKPCSISSYYKTKFFLDLEVVENQKAVCIDGVMIGLDIQCPVKEGKALYYATLKHINNVWTLILIN